MCLVGRMQHKPNLWYYMLLSFPPVLCVNTMLYMCNRNWSHLRSIALTGNVCQRVLSVHSQGELKAKSKHYRQRTLLHYKLWQHTLALSCSFSLNKIPPVHSNLCCATKDRRLGSKSFSIWVLNMMLTIGSIYTGCWGEGPTRADNTLSGKVNMSIQLQWSLV